MRFKSLELENFLSFGESQKINFVSGDAVLVLGINEEENGGSNGAGKTSILNGIVWALYGKTTKELSADDVVNNKINQDCKVSLELFKDKNHILINRYRKLEGKKNKLEVFVNGKNVSRANMADTQKVIDDIIKINFRSFISSVMFSQDRVFNFTTAKPQKRKEIIENVLQVENLSIYEKLFKSELSKIVHERDETNYRIRNQQNLIDSLVQSNKDYIQSCKVKQKQLKQKLIEYKKEREFFDRVDIEQELSKINSNKEVKTKISEINHNLEINQQKLDSLKKTISDKKKLFKKEKAKLLSLQKSFRTAVDNPKKCPLCGNIIDKEILDKYINDVTLQIKESEKNLAALEKDINSFEEAINDLSEKRVKFEKELKQVNNEYQNTEFQEEELIHLNEKKLELDNKIKSIKEQLKHIVDESYIDKIKEQAVKAKKIMKQEQKNLVALENDINHYTFWVQAFSKGENTIRSFLISKVINFINSRIAYYLNIFFNKNINFCLDMEMNHSIERDNIQISIEQLSGGEEQRINLAIAFSLFDLIKMNLGSDIDIIFLDEVLDKNLDDNGISALLKIIEDLKERHNAIYIISHKDNFKSYFARSMVVYKGKDGFSRILSG